MYVTAHHVVAPTGGAEGINSFCYEHGPGDWGVPPAEIPDQEPGELAYENISVPPPGNRVRSYLDVVAPDSAPWAEIRQSFLTFVTQVQRRPLPWVGVVGRCLFRIGLEGGLAADWQQEIAELYRAAQAARAGV
jgi:hypothetical protein